MVLPKIDELLTLLKGTKFFTALNLQSGYYQIILDEESMPKTAFKTVFGKFEFLRLHFRHLKDQISSLDSSMTFPD